MLNFSDNLSEIDNAKTVGKITLSKDTGTPVLTSDQLVHVEKIMTVFSRWYSFQDSSDMGTGKSFTILETARRYGYSIFVISPSGLMIKKWKKLAELFKVSIVVISYTSLAGKRGCPLSHPYLERSDEWVKNFQSKMNRETVFKSTEQFDKIVKSGTILVFDESQKDKNEDAMRTMACHKLVQRLVELNKSNESNSRIGVLSASPGNEARHTISLIKLLGIMNSENVYKWNPRKKRLNLLGFNEFVEFCKFLNPVLTQEILHRRGDSRAKFVDVTINDLYNEILKGWISHSMSAPKTGDYANGFYNIEPEYSEKLIIAINDLANMSGYRESNSQKYSTTCNLTIFHEILQKIETYKVPTVARLVRSDIENCDTCKIVIYVNNYSSVDTLMNMLADLNPVEMSGRIPKANHEKIRDSFQADNNDLRIIIVTIGTGSVGLDFNDTHGNRPRILYLITRYNFLEEYQATGRINRINNKSVGTVRFVYGKGQGSRETRIIDSICRKSASAKTFLNDASVPFPGDYASFIEK